MAYLATHETYLVTASIPSKPVREASRALNIPYVNDDMHIGDKIRQVFPFNTVTDADRARIGAEMVKAAPTALLIDLLTKLYRSSFLAVDEYSAEVLADVKTLRLPGAPLASVRQQRVRIGQRDTALRASRQDLETAQADLGRK